MVFLAKALPMPQSWWKAQAIISTPATRANTGDLWLLVLTISLLLLQGEKWAIEHNANNKIGQPLCYLGSIHSYTPVSASVRVLETRVEQVDFKLTRDALQPSVEEGEQKDFEKLVERFLAPGELDQLVRSLLPAQTLRYRTYRERSEFLRGLTLNFPRITRLYRYVILKMCLWFLASTTNHLIKTRDY